jgi:hypothetical protein
MTHADLMAFTKYILSTSWSGYDPSCSF